MDLSSALVRALSGPVASDVAASLAVLAAVLSLRLLAVRALGRSRLEPEVKARWFHSIRTASLVVVLAGLLTIWTDELRGLALSIAAIAVALVIFLKEIILCFHGSFIRTTSGAFGPGDRIQAAGYRGDVVETGALTTTLLEVTSTGSKQTGRAIVIPNSVFVDMAIVNESYAGEYGLFTLKVPVGAETWPGSEERLLAAARDVCGDHVDAARRHIDTVGWRKGLGPDSVEPGVTVELVEPEKLALHVRFPAPTRLRGQVEQDILRRFLSKSASPSGSTDG